ncbi:hypothetical protein MOXK02_15300 [Moraxella sp. K02]
MPQVTLNGDAKQTLHQNLLQLLDEMGQTQGRFAVEINGKLIPKSQLANVTLQDGMNIEVVQAVGGG